MRQWLVAIVLVMGLLGGAQEGRAQFCPGVSPWVFDDVLASDPFCGFITRMAQQNVSLGCVVIDANHRLYCPNDTVTRKQMAAFMSRLGDALFPLNCGAGQVMKWNGTAWACANDNGGAGGGGTVTSVMAGTGLIGSPNPITGAGSLNIAAGYQLPQSCSNGQVPKSNGSGGWTCGADNTGGGGISGVTASAPLLSSGGSAPNISMSAGTQGQVLMGTAGAPAWTSSPVFAGSVAVVGTTLLGGNVGVGTNTPQARIHALSTSDPLPPRVESWGTSGFAAGWDFYLNGTGKGYVGVPDPAAAFGAGEMMLYGSSGVSTSIWSGSQRAMTFNSATHNAGVGQGPSPNARLVASAGSSNAYAMVGNGGSGTGVAGFSTSGTGVYGTSAAANSITDAGVWGVGTGSGSVGVHGEAHVANAVGVFGESSSAAGFGVYARNSSGGRALHIEGPATQSLNQGGTVKALIQVYNDGTIIRCYNGVTGSSTVPCGFSVSHPVVGNYAVNFGFQVDNRFSFVQSLANYPGTNHYIAAYSTNTITIGATFFYTAQYLPGDVPFFLAVY